MLHFVWGHLAPNEIFQMQRYIFVFIAKSILVNQIKFFSTIFFIWEYEFFASNVWWLLQWLLIAQQIKFRILTITYKAMNTHPTLSS